MTGSTPKKGLVGNSGLRGESSGAGLGERRMPPVSTESKNKTSIAIKFNNYKVKLTQGCK